MGFGAVLAHPIALVSDITPMERANIHFIQGRILMGTSPETFDQVKNILRKLDRSITDARQRRLDTDDSPLQAAPETPAQDKPGRARPMRPRPDGFRSDYNPSPRF